MEKKRSGFLQSITDIPLALKGFPKNLFRKDPKNAKELDLYLRELSAYLWIGLAILIVGVVLQVIVNDMIVGLIGFAFIIFVFCKRNNVKNGGLGDQIGDLSCPNCKEMVTYDENVRYEVLSTGWSVHATKLSTKSGEEAKTAPVNIIARGTETTKVEITCKCQKCGAEHSFTKSICTGECKKSQRNVAQHAADLVKLQIENEVREVSQAVFEEEESGRNTYGVAVQLYDLEKSVVDYFNV